MARIAKIILNSLRGFANKREVKIELVQAQRKLPFFASTISPALSIASFV